MTRDGIALCFSVIAAGCFHYPAAVAADAAVLAAASAPLSAPPAAASGATLEPAWKIARAHASFVNEHASQDTRQVADWIVDTNDNGGLPFAIVDKTDAKVFVFDADGHLRGAAPALLGLARGDDAVPGIGERKLSSIRPEERTTPAGRFVAALDRSVHGKTILWVNYDDAISMHPVITTNPRERRAQRLATPTAADNRISYGCINVPPQFFENIVRVAFTGTDGIVYVLPDTRSLREVFPAYARHEQSRSQADVPAVSAAAPSTLARQ